MVKISSSIRDDINYIDTLFENALDYTKREFKVCETSAALFSLDGLVNKQHITLAVMNPILEAPVIEADGQIIMKFLCDRVLGAVEQVKVTDINGLLEKLMAGFCVLLIDGCDYGIAFGTQGFEKRSVEEPGNETMQRGAKEGFVESYQTNVSLVRRRMKSTDLKFERMYVGKESKTPVVVCYLKGKAKDSLVQHIKDKIRECDINSVLAAGYLAGYIKKSGVFGNVGLTERPDTLCGKILEGRVAIMIDGTPTAMIVPNLFIENFQSFDDYANRPFYATFTRWIRYISFFISGFLPGMYVAIVVHRPELLPDTLLIKFAEEEAKTPFSVVWEVILVIFLYEVMREAGLRAPKALSQSVSIVGALVIGDTAVQSGLLSAPSLMVIASAAMAGYAIPKLYEQLSVLRLVLVAVGGVFGTFGIIMSGVFLVFNICSEETFGIPITAPVSPFSLKSMRDVFVRASWHKLSQNDINVSRMPGTKDR